MHRRIREIRKLPLLNKKTHIHGSLFSSRETDLSRNQPVILFDEKMVYVSDRQSRTKSKNPQVYSRKVSINGSSRSWKRYSTKTYLDP